MAESEDVTLSDEARRVLTRGGCLAGLCDDDIELLLTKAKRRTIKAGAVLFFQGQRGDSMAIVSDGLLSVRVADPRIRSVEVNRVGPGGLIGEMACVDPAPRSATVVASTDADILEIARAGLLELRATAPRVYTAVVGGVTRLATSRLRESERKIDELLGRAPAKKVVGAKAAEKIPEKSAGVTGWFKSVFGLRGGA